MTRVFALNYGSFGKPKRRAPMIMQTQTVPRGKILRRNLTAMNADGFSFSVMVGIAETYLPAFVLARGLGEVNAALIATIPVLLGSVLQLLSPMALQRLKSYRRFVVMTASIQASSMLILMTMALLPHVPAWAIFIPATLYWAAGLATGPAWNTWVEYLVPQRIRSGFFARRSRMCQIGVLLGLIAGGLFLKWSVAHNLTVAVFAVLFGIGAIGRYVSALMLARQTEQPNWHGAGNGDEDDQLSGDPRQLGDGTDEHGKQDAYPTEFPNIVSAKERFAAIVQALKHPGSAGRLVLFLMVVQTAVHVSGPYFTPYMLRVLKMSWMEYMCLLSLGFFGKMLALPWAGRFANRFGSDRLLWVGSIGIVPVSAMWFFSQNIWWLAGIQILSGLVWGCYELAMLLQFFHQIPSERRVAVLTLYNLGNSAAMVLGTVIGGLFLNALGRGTDAYLTLFVASGFMRFCALLAMPGRHVAVHTTRGVVSAWMGRSVRRYVHSAHAMRAVQGVHMNVSQASRVSDVVLSIHEGSSITSRVIDDGGTTKRRDGSSVSQSG
ncbi:MAG: MFS transporter [Planctomycetota bacterium]|nr:MFS transporter [Planctomycetales bacterium]RLT05282.1 MAG: MFS transporter [Planctomycetota bacterium]